MQPVSMRSENDRQISRMARLGAGMVGRDEHDVRESLFSGTVRIGIATDLVRNADSRLTLLTLFNHVVRFCRNVVLDVKNEVLVRECLVIAASIHGERHRVRRVNGVGGVGTADAVVVVGPTNPGTDVIVVTSEGWLARLASGPKTPRVLPMATSTPNAVGAIAAACLASGEVFLRLIGFPATSRNAELTMLTGEAGPIGTFHCGPDLSEGDLHLDALLVGCGGVGNGWAYAVKYVPLSGDLKAVDRQLIGLENIGPYVLATSADLGSWKVDIIRTYLSPGIKVTPFPEEFDLFTPRITTFGNFKLPPVVICGLDTALPRHSVQRQWPETLIDLAAGGATAQVHVHQAGKGGQCLFGAHTFPPDEPSYSERVAEVTGIRRERILSDYTRPITEADVAAAPERHKASLEASRRDGELICGRIRQANMEATDDDDSFAPAAPFVAGLAGVMGASLTLQAQMGMELVSGFHWQYSFQSGRSRCLVMSCFSGCECHRKKRARPRWL